MNEIKIYLKTSGSIAELYKDFNLYRGSYQNTIISIYVPKSLLYSNAETTFVNAVKSGAILTAPNGDKLNTKSYFAAYVKDETRDGVDYSVYAQTLPKEYVVYAGSQTVVVNVESIDNTDSAAPKVLSITTTQTALLIVQESAYLGDDDPIDPSQISIINGRIDSNTERISVLEPQVAQNTEDIAENTKDIAQNTNDIDYLYDHMSQPEEYIGRMTGEQLPTDEELTAFVIAHTTPSRAPKNGDVIIFIQVLTGTDKNYKYFYSVSGWDGYEIPPTEKASNGTYGIVQGTYNIGSNNSTQIDISGGEIKNIFLKEDGDSEAYFNLRSGYLAQRTVQQNILNGTQPVGLANKAISDKLGNEINTTYAIAEDYYTKDYVDNNFLRNTYTNIFYYSAQGLVDDIPKEPADGIQFTKTIQSIGESNIFEVSMALEGVYNFSKNSSDQSSVWISVNRNCILQFRLTTSVKKTDETSTLLSAQLTGETEFIANTPQKIDIAAIYSALGNAELKTEDGDLFVKKLDVISTESTPTTIQVLSSELLPSTFNLTVQQVSLDVNYIGGLKGVQILSNEWTEQEDGAYRIVVPQTKHQQIPTSNYVLELQKQVGANSYQRIAFTPQVDTDGNITIETYEALDCLLLIGAAVTEHQREVLTLTNPTVLPTIDYSGFGTLRIYQTETPTELFLPFPKNTDYAYTIFVSNGNTSTQDILVNGETISPTTGLQYYWNGSSWEIPKTARIKFADEAAHALTADNAEHAETAESANNANHAETSNTSESAKNAETANSAVKSTNDGVGNNIVNTYAKKSEVLKTFVTVSELGLSLPTTTVAIMNALPDNTMFFYAVEDSSQTISDVPQSYGLLMIWYRGGNRVEVTYQRSLATDHQQWEGIWNYDSAAKRFTSIEWQPFAYQDGTYPDMTVGNSNHAVNVTTNINGKAITSIFEGDGITAKKAKDAETSVNVTTNINGKAISSIFESDGITVKKATNAGSASNVTTNINGKAITSIFESNGTVVKKATSANKVENALTINVNGAQTVFDGAAAKSVAINTGLNLSFSQISLNANGTHTNNVPLSGYYLVYLYWETETLLLNAGIMRLENNKNSTAVCGTHAMATTDFFAVTYNGNKFQVYEAGGQVSWDSGTCKLNYAKIADLS